MLAFIKKIEIYFISFFFLIVLIYISAYPQKEYAIIGICILLVILTYFSIRFQLYHDVEIPKAVTKKNSDIITAIKEIHKLFDIALEQILIVSGTLNEKIWGSENIIKDFESFKLRKIELSIIVGKKLNIKKDSNLYNFLKDNAGSKYLNLYVCDETPTVHFIIVDNSHLRLEEKHEPNDDERKAEIKYYSGALAGRAKTRFEDYRVKSQLITKDDFLNNNNKVEYA